MTTRQPGGRHLISTGGGTTQHLAMHRPGRVASLRPIVTIPAGPASAPVRHAEAGRP